MNIGWLLNPWRATKQANEATAYWRRLYQELLDAHMESLRSFEETRDALVAMGISECRAGGHTAYEVCTCFAGDDIEVVRTRSEAVAARLRIAKKTAKEAKP